MNDTHTPRFGIRTLRLLAVALTGLLAVAGCSVDQNSQDAGKPTIRLAYQSFPSGDLVVKNNGWLEEALPDYNIRWTKFDSGADVNTAFVAGEVDFGAIGSSPVARGLSAPLNIPYQVAFVLDVAGDNEALVARDGTGIETVADLRGRKVGTAFASTAHYSLLAALGQAGVGADEVQLIDLQPQASLAAWERGDIDAVYTWLPTLDQLRESGTTLVSSRELATAGKPTLDLGVVATAFATEHPEAVDAWRRVQARALDTIANDPDAAASAVAAEIGITEEEAANQLSQGVFLSPAELTSPEWLGTEDAVGSLAVNLQAASQFLAEQNQIDAAPPLETFQDAIYVKGLPDVLDE
ncbi:ABC transporter substrate-binding protein [Rhodococcus triatomae]|uniref:Taurine transport system substrate-binding protein n=1 Tax=Rhodococcus triatomae TaxID=300028 RepID=A0A1G8CGR0_9NOCA|nr:ABC transporter substrate-binding protein [Rhodococcus triatomae]QNG18657.1 ABC transporter substrate-binding protein [Rhodococcus triatomae]QNG21673.1 ABC transporter substrate-binding protein [Rhodococcus triatomae]SDH44588.1 taurine transport system substrate-binding protein [Rhodococcus triatomae]